MKDSSLSEEQLRHANGGLLVALSETGFAFMRELSPEVPTIEIAHALGVPIDMTRLLPNARIPTVQDLVPRRKEGAPKNQYSGHYGLADFPLHTDLAHWFRPPRYFMLRCIRGEPSVSTYLLPAAAIANHIGQTTLARAVARPRRAPSAGAHCLLPLLFSDGLTVGFRWDPLFLVPMNKAAHAVETLMSAYATPSPDIGRVQFEHPGDTLLIDNWRFLHGRSSVQKGGTNRYLQRIYMSEINA